MACVIRAANLGGKNMNRISRLSVAIGVVLGAYVAMAPAVADVPRYQSMTFSLHTDVGPGIDAHNYAMAYNPCDGTVVGTGGDTVVGYDEELLCSLVGNALSCDGLIIGSIYDGQTYTYAANLDLTGIPTIGTTVFAGFPYPTSFAVSNVANSTWKNHGAFVSANPDKNDAAHSCIGMPIVSQQ